MKKELILSDSNIFLLTEMQFEIIEQAILGNKRFAKLYNADMNFQAYINVSHIVYLGDIRYDKRKNRH